MAVIESDQTAQTGQTAVSPSRRAGAAALSDRGSPPRAGDRTIQSQH